MIVILVILALVFDFLNGFHDSANVVATMIASRAMSPRAALWIAALANFVGPLLFGVAVAKTIGSDVADPAAITVNVLLAALLSASIWNLATWFFGIPSSSSHALIGGIFGAVMLEAGFSALRMSGLVKIALALFFSPLIGFLIGLLVMRLTMLIVRGASPRANIFFKYIQIPTAIALALSHGTNDAQKTMGMMTAGLVALGFQSHFHVPLWVMLTSAGAIGLGTALGGWRIIQTMGVKFYRIRPIHSFSSQLSSAVVIMTASLFGGPVSTTHVVSTSILGAGYAQRRSQVRWRVMVDIIIAWLLTVPVSAGLGAVCLLLIRLLLP